MPDSTALPGAANNEKTLFSDISWKAAIVCGLISIIAGGSSGAGIVATKAVQINGITQDQADVRYLSKSEAAALRDSRDKQMEQIRKDQLTREIFEAYHQNDVERMNRIEKTLERLLEK